MDTLVDMGTHHKVDTANVPSPETKEEHVDYPCIYGLDAEKLGLKDATVGDIIMLTMKTKIKEMEAHDANEYQDRPRYTIGVEILAAKSDKEEKAQSNNKEASEEDIPEKSGKTFTDLITEDEKPASAEPGDNYEK